MNEDTELLNSLVKLQDNDYPVGSLGYAILTATIRLIEERIRLRDEGFIK